MQVGDLVTGVVSVWEFMAPRVINLAVIWVIASAFYRTPMLALQQQLIAAVTEQNTLWKKAGDVVLPLLKPTFMFVAFFGSLMILEGLYQIALFLGQILPGALHADAQDLFLRTAPVSDLAGIWQLNFPRSQFPERLVDTVLKYVSQFSEEKKAALGFAAIEQDLDFWRTAFALTKCYGALALVGMVAMVFDKKVVHKLVKLLVFAVALTAAFSLELYHLLSGYQDQMAGYTHQYLIDHSKTIDPLTKRPAAVRATTEYLKKALPAGKRWWSLGLYRGVLLGRIPTFFDYDPKREQGRGWWDG